MPPFDRPAFSSQGSKSLTAEHKLATAWSLSLGCYNEAWERVQIFLVILCLLCFLVCLFSLRQFSLRFLAFWYQTSYLLHLGAKIAHSHEICSILKLKALHNFDSICIISDLRSFVLAEKSKQNDNTSSHMQCCRLNMVLGEYVCVCVCVCVCVHVMQHTLYQHAECRLRHNRAGCKHSFVGCYQKNR